MNLKHFIKITAFFFLCTSSAVQKQKSIFSFLPPRSDFQTTSISEIGESSLNNSLQESVNKAKNIAILSLKNGKIKDFIINSIEKSYNSSGIKEKFKDKKNTSEFRKFIKDVLDSIKSKSFITTNIFYLEDEKEGFKFEHPIIKVQIAILQREIMMSIYNKIGAYIHFFCNSDSKNCNVFLDDLSKKISSEFK